MKRSTIVGLLIASSAFVASQAAFAGDDSSGAGQDAAAPKKRGEIVLPTYEITGHYNRPQATMMVTRLPAALSVVTLSQDLLQRISDSILKGPF